MTEEQRQKYIDTMKKKALNYAENVLSDIKTFMPKEDYEDTINDIAQAFVSGGDAAIQTVNEILHITDKPKTNQ